MCQRLRVRDFSQAGVSVPVLPFASVTLPTSPQLPFALSVSFPLDKDTGSPGWSQSIKLLRLTLNSPGAVQ